MLIFKFGASNDQTSLYSDNHAHNQQINRSTTNNIRKHLTTNDIRFESFLGLPVSATFLACCEPKHQAQNCMRRPNSGVEILNHVQHIHVLDAYLYMFILLYPDIMSYSIYIYIEAKSRIQNMKEKYDDLRNSKSQEANLALHRRRWPHIISFSRARCLTPTVLRVLVHRSIRMDASTSLLQLTVSWNETMHRSLQSICQFSSSNSRIPKHH